MGTAPFRYLELNVGAGVFIPRPETEVLVSTILDLHLEAPRIADLCTGSGAIALSLATEIPNADVVAVELSTLASTYFEQNLRKYSEVIEDMGSRVTLNISDATTFETSQKFDVIASNPPYIPKTGTISEQLSAEVHADPPEALFGGDLGFEIPSRIIKAASKALKIGGFFIMEHLETQGPEAEDVLINCGFSQIRHIQDLANNERFTTGVLGSSEEQGLQSD
jgi:release factor glutamine methyltransferase